jgi:periplasmic mercuric ion binding protein
MKLRMMVLLGSLSLFTACNSNCSLPLSGSTNQSAASTEAPSSETKTVSFQVEGMSCPAGCYPSVRSAIAKQKGVMDVELAPQKEEGVIDNPVVFVKYQGDLDLQATFKAIERAGFEAKTLSN